MRPIRLLILLLAIALTLVLALVRPLQGRATRAAKRHRRPCGEGRPAGRSRGASPHGSHGAVDVR